MQVDKLKVLSESLANSALKAEKRISENRLMECILVLFIVALYVHVLIFCTLLYCLCHVWEDLLMTTTIQKELQWEMVDLQKKIALALFELKFKESFLATMIAEKLDSKAWDWKQPYQTECWFSTCLLESV